MVGIVTPPVREGRGGGVLRLRFVLKEGQIMFSTRREFLTQNAWGFGGLALATMLMEEQAESAVANPGDGGVLEVLHHPAKAKRVAIWAPCLRKTPTVGDPLRLTHSYPLTQIE